MEKQTQADALETKRIFIFLGITFLITYIVELGVIRPFLFSGDATKAAIAQMLISLVMLVPAIGVFFTRLITKEGFHDLTLKQNKWKGNIRYYVFGWVGPVVLTIAGAVLYFLIFRNQFDRNMTYMSEMYQQSGVTLTSEQLQAGMISQVILALVMGPVLNALNCFGEEWGWRGYLLPKMRQKFSILPMLLINGVIWGLWHAPLTALGHNYGMHYKGFPFTGILAMCVFCIVMGTIFSYLTIKTGSCVPAILAHGSLNGIAAAGVFYTADGGNPFVGPSPTGIIGGAAFIIVAIVCAVLLMKEDKKTLD